MATAVTDSIDRWDGGELSRSCFVDGAWSDGEGAATRVVDPATEATLADVRFASERQVRAAIAAARRAFDAGPWKEMSPADRSLLLHRLCDLMEAEREQLVEDLIAETGSPLALAQVGQFQSALDCLRWFAEAARSGPPGGWERGLPLHGDGPISAGVMRHEPAGVVAAITAYNYPLLLLARKLGGVLASGCTAVVLPSERAPLATWRFFGLLEQVGYPAGVVNLVVGGREAGVELSTSPEVDMISFTGSVKVGREVMRQGAATTKRVVLELGGKSPTIVLPGADLERCVGPSIARFTIASGQGCGCTTRTLVAREDYDAYLDAAKHVIDGLTVGDPRAEGTDMGPLIRGEHRASVEGYVERALAAGGEIVAGGGRPDLERGFYMNPAFVAGVDNDAEIAQQELFGPVGVLLPYASVEEAVALANRTRFGLYASVWGPPEDAMRVARAVSAGTVGVNGGGPLRPDVPWGGYRDTGNGREAGEDGFREFFEVKHIQWTI